MAKKSDVQYIRYYTVGSAARKLAPQVTEQPKAAPKPRKAKRVLVFIDPVAILGIVTAVIMLTCMLVGMVQLNEVWTRQAAVENQVQRLIRENETLQETYEAGYDLANIEKTALALGMVPAEQVEHIPLGN